MIMKPKSTTVITGATGGIGSALTQLYAQQKNTMIGLVARDRQRLEQLIQSCSQQAGLEYAAIDTRDQQALSDWLNSIDNRYQIDTLIANAGVTCGLSPNHRKEQDEQAKRVIDINYQGTVNTISAIVDNMIERRSGHIVIVASLAGLGPLADMPSYSASKAAIIAYGHALRRWLKPFNIQVTIICPGFVTSPMSKRHIGQKPFEISAEKAAIKIKKAIDHQKRFYAFPFLLAAGIYACKLMPVTLSDLFMKPFRATIKQDPRF